MGTILYNISLIWTFLHCVIMFMFLYESRYSAIKTNIITSIIIAPLVALNMASVLILGMEKAGQLLLLFCVIPSFIFFFIMAKNRDSRFLFTFCLADTIILEVAFVTNILDTFLGLGNNIVLFAGRIILLPAIEFLILKYLRKPYHILQQYTKKGWGIFSLLGAIFYLTMIVTAFYPTILTSRPEYYPHIILILILVPVMYITVFVVLWKQIEIFRISRENNMLNLQMKMIDENLKTRIAAEKDLKILRHDIRHNLILLNDYIQNGKISDAQKFISKLSDSIDKTSVKTFCVNNSVNVIISHYNSIAVENEIDFEAKLQLSELLPVDETDFAVILSNALENAINAQKECSDKKIRVNAFENYGHLYIEIKNSFCGEIQFSKGFPVCDSEDHGYGTRSIAAIIKKYNGTFSFTAENGLFVFRGSM